MKVYLTTAYKDNFIPELLRSKDSLANSICVSDPAEADVIIFAESHPWYDPYYRDVLNNKIYKRYRDKCVLYHDADKSITTLPTLAPNIESWQFNPKHKRVAHYVATQYDNRAINNAVIDFRSERKYLYNFYGNKSHPIRSSIFAISHPSDVFLKDMAGINTWELNDGKRLAFGLEYVEVMQESYFTLAPRGIGPCSYRLFEAMQLGRVPVIISDEWVKIPGIDWDKFSITIPESKIDQIPFLLKERKEEAVNMGRLARKQWEENFSPEVSLRHLAKAAAELLKNKYTLIDSIQDYTQFIKQPGHLRNYARTRVKRLVHEWRKEKANA